MTLDEFKKAHTGLIKDNIKTSKNKRLKKIFGFFEKKIEIKNEIDWRYKMNPIQD